MKKINVLTLVCALMLPLLVGMLSSYLSSSGMAAYGSMDKPPLSPPAWVFPTAWTILYLMMGVASYYVIVSEADPRSKTIALVFYMVQLAMNFMWSIIFFDWKMYLFAFAWLFVMWCFVVGCTFRFYIINSLSGYLMIPYIIWLTFAAYLNLGAWFLSRQS